MSKKETLIYLAGCLDCDGYISIKKSTYAMRVRKDATNPVYSEKIGFVQVKPEIPNLFKELFGGMVRACKSRHENRKDIYRWQCTDNQAAEAVKALYPYLRIKKQQATSLLELRESKNPTYRQHSFWFQRENPDWTSGELLTASEVRSLLGWSKVYVCTALHNGTLVGVDGKGGPKEVARFPKQLVEMLAEHRTKRGRLSRPRQLIKWRESLFDRVKQLNMLGKHGTSVNHRTGYHGCAV
jgi:hypothetical protein